MKNSINDMSNVSRQGLYIRSLDILSGEVIATSNELQALDVANQVKHSNVVHQFTLDVKKRYCCRQFPSQVCCMRWRKALCLSNCYRRESDDTPCLSLLFIVIEASPDHTGSLGHHDYGHNNHILIYASS